MDMCCKFPLAVDEFLLPRQFLIDFGQALEPVAHLHFAIHLAGALRARNGLPGLPIEQFHRWRVGRQGYSRLKEVT